MIPAEGFGSLLKGILKIVTQDGGGAAGKQCDSRRLCDLAGRPYSHGRKRHLANVVQRIEPLQHHQEIEAKLGPCPIVDI